MLLYKIRNTPSKEDDIYPADNSQSTLLTAFLVSLHRPSLPGLPDEPQATPRLPSHLTAHQLTRERCDLS